MKINQRLTLCFSLLFCLLSISYASAQQLNISGVVISSEDNEPLIGATVSVKGNPTKGVITDINGQFQLSVETGTKMLVVSYVGMKTQEIRVPRKEKELKIVLIPETMDIDDSLVDAHNLLDRLEGEFGHNNHMRDMDELMTATMVEAEGRIANNKNGVTDLPTGLADLDRMTSGLQKGELVVVAARPGVGKTAFALHMARSAAMAGYAVAVYSLEMQGERLADRWLTAVSEISARHWRSGTVSQQELVEARTTAADLKRLPIHVDDSTSVNMEHIRSSARLLQSQHACDAIIIDYLQLCDMTTGQNNRNREQEVAQATRKAKLLAKELNVPVVLLSQLNRESENRPAGRPELAHLRESGAIEQDADVVMLLYRPALARVTTDRESGYPTEGLGVVIIAKQRNGETGNVYFRHNPEMTKITEYVPPLEYMLKHAK